MLGKQIQGFITPSTKKKKKRQKRVTMKLAFKHGKRREKIALQLLLYRKNLTCNVNKPSFCAQTGGFPLSR